MHFYAKRNLATIPCGCFVLCLLTKSTLKWDTQEKKSASHTNPKKNHSVNVGFGNQKKLVSYCSRFTSTHLFCLIKFTRCVFLTKQVKQQLQIVRGFKIPQSTWCNKVVCNWFKCMKMVHNCCILSQTINHKILFFPTVHANKWPRNCATRV